MPLEAVLIGAGLGGRHVHGRWALADQDALRIVAVAEPDDVRRTAVAS